MRSAPLLCLGVAVTMSAALVAPAAAATPTPSKPDRATGTRLTPQTPASSSTPRADDPFARSRAVEALARVADTGTTRLVLRAQRGTDLAGLAERARGHGAVVERKAARTSSVTVEVPTAKAAAFTAAVDGVDGVVDVQPAQRYSYGWTPADAQYAQQTPYFTAVRAETAWDSTRGDGVRVAVIDSGVDTTHPELTGVVVARYNATDGTTSIVDDAGHGTAVTSVIAAETSSTGMVGAASGADVLAVKVEDAYGDIWSDDVANGIRWAVAEGADVINISLGAGAPDALTRDAVAAARAAGVVVVAAAGNEGTTALSYPAAYPGVVSVGATTADGTSRASFSNHGSWVAVAAPGQGVLAALPRALDADGYAVVAGTSFSAPLVAADAALVRSTAPTLSGAEVERTLLGAHDGKQLGFARGVVDYAAAITPVPDALPEMVQPVAGETVTGAVTATALSPAERVRFGVSGTAITVDAPVVDGRATAVVPTWGLTGTRTITAAACSAYACAAQTATASVLVANPQPVLTAPAAGAVVGTALTASATTAGGGVRFLVDGVPVAFRPAAPYTSAIPTSSLADGAHVLTAVQCSTDGSLCDTVNPSQERSFTVKRLRPTVSAGPSPFSPNGDGRRDTATLTYRLEQPQTVDLRITNAAGTVVRSGRLGTNRLAGSYTWTWNGRNNGGTLLGDGTYRVEVRTSRTLAGGVVVHGVAAVNVRLDRTKPGLGAVTRSPSTVYPVVDGYGDSTRLSVPANEALSVLEARVFNSAGSLVRVVRVGPQPAGTRSVVWNGRTASGTVVPAGSYTFQLAAYDVAGNAALTARTTLAVSWKKLVARTGTQTVTPAASRAGLSIGDCSAIFRPGRSSWVDSYGYYSNYDFPYCDGYTAYDLAAATHRFTLPAAVKYGNVRISAYGASYPGYTDHGALVYLRPDGSGTGQGAVLGWSAGSYSGPTVPASTLLSGRTLTWLTGTVDYNWYDVKSFTINYSYWVLA